MFYHSIIFKTLLNPLTNGIIVIYFNKSSLVHLQKAYKIILIQFSQQEFSCLFNLYNLFKRGVDRYKLFIYE